MRQLWMLVGGNGAGKSTFYNQALKPLGMPFINADLIAKDVFPDEPEINSYHASRLAQTLRFEQLDLGKSFCFETVFSHPSKIDFIARAKARGYQVILVVIHVYCSDLNKARIAQRVEEGGHYVPDDKVVSRIPRTLENVATAIPLCDEVWILDNSSLQQPFLPVITIKQGQRREHVSPLPEWVKGF